MLNNNVSFGLLSYVLIANMNIMHKLFYFRQEVRKETKVKEVNLGLGSLDHQVHLAPQVQ
jgi:hypothetical protein